MLLEGVRHMPVSSKSILDIGCGVGALHLTLLKEGAARATGVDISEGMLERAREYSKTLGLQEKTEYILGDFVEQGATLESADITLLDKVVCCYEDVATLVTTSTGKTRSIYAVSHPRENFIMLSIFKTQIFFSKLFRAQFVPFWHDWPHVREMIRSNGFEQVYQNSTIAWNVVVYQRVGEGAQA